jgi:hypothetical protein
MFEIYGLVQAVLKTGYGSVSLVSDADPAKDACHGSGSAFWQVAFSGSGSGFGFVSGSVSGP